MSITRCFTLFALLTWWAMSAHALAGLSDDHRGARRYSIRSTRLENSEDPDAALSRGLRRLAAAKDRQEARRDKKRAGKATAAADSDPVEPTKARRGKKKPPPPAETTKGDDVTDLGGSADQPPPNVILIVTDDQDDLFNSTHPHYMPALDKWMGQRGTRLTNFLASTGVCCPARLNVLTGQYAHCHNVTGNSSPNGGFAAFKRYELDRNWLPLWLQQAGYNTYLVGKFLNGYLSTGNEANPYLPRGWTVHDALSTNPYVYIRPCFALNGAPEVCTSVYQTDLLQEKVLGYLGDALESPKPFFMYVAPVAPHQAGGAPPNPAKRHQNLYSNETITMPKGPNYGALDPAIPLEPVDDIDAATPDLERFYLQRLRSLRAVDEMLDAMFEKLEAANALDNTYVMYSSDNALHLGQFSLTEGKATSIEEDVRIPFYAVGPGITQGAEMPYQGNLIDIAPTIMNLAGLPIPSIVDGIVLPISSRLTSAHVNAMAVATANGVTQPPTVTPSLLSSWRRDAMLLEAWDSDGKATTQGVVFKSLRVCTDYLAFPGSGRARGGESSRYSLDPGRACYKYTVWCSGAKELYDLSVDPYEVDNRIGDADGAFVDRLDGVMSALVHCKGNTCRSPYALLHPGQNVMSFTQAMDPKYDRMYSRLQKFRYIACRNAYVRDNEPTWAVPGSRK